MTESAELNGSRRGGRNGSGCPRDGRRAGARSRRAQRPLLGHRRRRPRAHRGVAGRGAGDQDARRARLRGRYRCRHLRRRHRARLVRGGLRPRRPRLPRFHRKRLRARGHRHAGCRRGRLPRSPARLGLHRRRHRHHLHQGPHPRRGHRASACACALRAGTPHGRLRAERHRRRPRRPLRGSRTGSSAPTRRRCPRTSSTSTSWSPASMPAWCRCAARSTTPPWPW